IDAVTCWNGFMFCSVSCFMFMFMFILSHLARFRDIQVAGTKMHLATSEGGDSPFSPENSGSDGENETRDETRDVLDHFTALCSREQFAQAKQLAARHPNRIHSKSVMSMFLKACTS